MDKVAFSGSNEVPFMQEQLAKICGMLNCETNKEIKLVFDQYNVMQMSGVLDYNVISKLIAAGFNTSLRLKRYANHVQGEYIYEQVIPIGGIVDAVTKLVEENAKLKEENQSQANELLRLQYQGLSPAI